MAPFRMIVGHARAKAPPAKSELHGTAVHRVASPEELAALAHATADEVMRQIVAGDG